MAVHKAPCFTKVDSSFLQILRVSVLCVKSPFDHKLSFGVCIHLFKESPKRSDRRHIQPLTRRTIGLVIRLESFNTTQPSSFPIRVERRVHKR